MHTVFINTTTHHVTVGRAVGSTQPNIQTDASRRKKSAVMIRMCAPEVGVDPTT